MAYRLEGGREDPETQLKLKERRMAMGERICPYCGARLDPDEKCDCREENQQEESPAPDGRQD